MWFKAGRVEMTGLSTRAPQAERTVLGVRVLHAVSVAGPVESPGACLCVCVCVCVQTHL